MKSIQFINDGLKIRELTQTIHRVNSDKNRYYERANNNTQEKPTLGIPNYYTV